MKSPASAIPGVRLEPGAVLEEHGRPDFRDAFGLLAERSTEILVAVTRVRLSTVDLTEREMARVERLRVIVAELSALRLEAEARGLHADPRRIPNLELLRGLLESERLEIRSAPLAGWSPDFTVFADQGGPHALLTGFHWFERPYPHMGPALNTLHVGDGARMAARRHGELWERAHDVGPAVWTILSRVRTRARSFRFQAG